MRSAYLLCVPLFACATTRAQDKMPAAEAFHVAPSSPTVLPKGPACERAARDERDRDLDRAWRLLQICAAHDQLAQLEPVLEYWSKELTTRPEATTVLARLLANRTTLQTDLGLLQKRGVQVFDLTTAMRRPGAFHGRLVAFMGELRESSAPNAVMLQELTSVTERIEVPASLQRHIDTHAVVNGQHHTERTRVMDNEVRYRQSTEESGRDIIARLSGPSLTLSAERPHLFLARFRGVQQLDHALDEDAAVVDVVTYEDLVAW